MRVPSPPPFFSRRFAPKKTCKTNKKRDLKKERRESFSSEALFFFSRNSRSRRRPRGEGGENRFPPNGCSGSQAPGSRRRPWARGARRGRQGQEGGDKPDGRGGRRRWRRRRRRSRRRANQCRDGDDDGDDDDGSSGDDGKTCSGFAALRDASGHPPGPVLRREPPATAPARGSPDGHARQRPGARESSLSRRQRWRRSFGICCWRYENKMALEKRWGARHGGGGGAALSLSIPWFFQSRCGDDDVSDTYRLSAGPGKAR